MKESSKVREDNRETSTMTISSSGEMCWLSFVKRLKLPIRVQCMQKGLREQEDNWGCFRESGLTFRGELLIFI